MSAGEGGMVISLKCGILYGVYGAVNDVYG